MNQEFVKLDRFDGTNFNRWKDKMMFLLSVLNLAYVIDPKTTPIADAAEKFHTGRGRRDCSIEEEM